MVISKKKISKALLY